MDVGAANIGLITLYGSWLVGPEGRVDSFEPNPACYNIVEKNLAMNQIRNVVLHKVATF